MLVTDPPARAYYTAKSTHLQLSTVHIVKTFEEIVGFRNLFGFRIVSAEALLKLVFLVLSHKLWQLKGNGCLEVGWRSQGEGLL